jgi:hypothetical protein
VLFNNSLARNLWNLEKVRFLPAKAETRFDTAIPERERLGTYSGLHEGR